MINDNPRTARSLVELFEALFDPAPIRSANRDAQAAAAAVAADIDALVSLDTDRVLRAFASMIQATLRTNYFVTRTDSARAQNVLSFKLNPQLIDELPLPRPKFEIFVYSPRVEGVHLRFGHVARGGLRWSDRREDFRTEILGLVKAQAVKNAVIVPVGAKGGFVVKQPPLPTGDAAADRDAHPQRGRRLLQAVHLRPARRHRQRRPAQPATSSPRPDVVRRDGDDAYLVVAADKGTATFSDIANDVAKSYGFWLGDAFASGGSVGYDHKAMGITAKGAWESGQAALPRDGRRHPDRGLHRRRHRRHERRRVRQRHAAVQAHSADRRVRPPAHLPRPRPRRRDVVGRTQAACSTCRGPAGTTTTSR